MTSQYVVESWATGTQTVQMIEPSPAPAPAPAPVKRRGPRGFRWDDSGEYVRGYACKMLRSYGIIPSGQEDDIVQDAWILWYRSIPAGPGGQLTCKKAMAWACRAWLRKQGYSRWMITHADGTRIGPFTRRRTALARAKKLGWDRDSFKVSAVSSFKPIPPNIPARPAGMLADLEEVNGHNEATQTLVRMLSAGYSSKDVATHLNVSAPYVSKLLANVRETLGADYLTPESSTIQHSPMTQLVPFIGPVQPARIADGIVRLTSDRSGTLFSGPYVSGAGHAVYHPAPRESDPAPFSPITDPAPVRVRAIRPARPARPDSVSWFDYMDAFGIPHYRASGKLSASMVSYVSRLRTRIITTLSI